MKQKIYRSMCLVALFSMVVGTLLTAWMICRDLQTQMRRSVVTEVRYLESAMEVSGQEFLNHLSSRGDGNSINRITWVAADGEVLYDSYADRENLENHGQRPEIQAALKNGRGESERSSNTLAEQTYYYASRLSDGTVIRVASTIRSGFATVMNTIPWMVVMAAAIFGVTMMLAELQTRRIVEPINRLNPNAPLEEKIYDELSPLVRKLEKQKETIRKQMDILKEKQEEFTAITEHMQEGFLVIDSKADVISYNGSAIRILGVDRNALAGNSNILSFNRLAGFRQMVDQALDGQRSELMMELNGRFYQLLANPVAETNDKWGVVLVMLDVTEQKGREDLRREFSANVSHELKTPLTSISGYAEIMKNGMVKQEDVGRFSEKIYTEAQRLITLVGDIIRLSQLDEEQAEAERTTVDLYQRAAEIVERLKDPAGKQKVTLELSGSSTKVQGAAQILDEMIFNLCDNAIKYNHPGGWVKVMVSAEEGHPVLLVEDNGIGIAKGEQERIFERFYRVDKSHSKQIGGTGLGLSIVKHGAAYHKAQVEMESSLGKGTQVKIVF